MNKTGNIYTKRIAIEKYITFQETHYAKNRVKASVVFRTFKVTVHSYIPVGRFHARMKICLHECTKGAPSYEQKGAAKQRRATKWRFCEWRGVNCNHSDPIPERHEKEVRL